MVTVYDRRCGGGHGGDVIERFMIDGAVEENGGDLIDGGNGL